VGKEALHFARIKEFQTIQVEFMLCISGRFLKVNETRQGMQERSATYVTELLQLGNIGLKV